MKEIRGHKERSAQEIAELMLARGSFTYPNLPHYRYRGTQANVRTLLRLGLAEAYGQHEIHCFIRPTPALRAWEVEWKAGRATSGVVRWGKRLRDEQQEQVAA